MYRDVKHGAIWGKVSDMDYRHWIAALDLHHGLSSRTWC